MSGYEIRKYRLLNNLTQRELADKLGVTPKAISFYELDERNPPNDLLVKMARILRVSTDTLLGFSNPFGSRPINHIPVLGTIAAGIPIDAIENVIDWEEIPADWLRGGAEYFALKIKGSSMEPRIFDGDVVIVRKQPTVESGQIAAVLINGEEATIKKLKITPEGVMLIGLNPSVFEPRFYSRAEVESLPVTVLGLVVEVRGKLA